MPFCVSLLLYRSIIMCGCGCRGGLLDSRFLLGGDFLGDGSNLAGDFEQILK